LQDTAFTINKPLLEFIKKTAAPAGPGKPGPTSACQIAQI
jgi:hypothetical protein